MPPNITELLHCAEPLFSRYLKGFKFDEPEIKRGRFLFFLNLNFAPNLDRGSEILKKSLFDKLSSPINFIGYGVFIKKPRINLPNVPEFSAFSIRFFYTYIH